MFFNGWVTLLRTLVVGIPSYVGVILLLRASGKRTLSKMNAFDLVVTVALGFPRGRIYRSGCPCWIAARGCLAFGSVQLGEQVATLSGKRKQKNTHTAGDPHAWLMDVAS